MELIVSFLLGVLASGLAWLCVMHGFKPKVQFGKHVAIYDLPNGGHIIQGVFRNSGHRSIIDLEVYVRIGIKNYLGASGWASHNVRSNASRIPSLARRTTRRVRMHDTRENILFLDQPSEPLREAINSCGSLKEVLSLGSDASVTIHVFGYDPFSGTRTHSSSKAYRLADMKVGTFEGLEVVPKISKSTPPSSLEDERTRLAEHEGGH